MLRSYQVSFAECSSDQLDESTHKTASFCKSQQLFSPKVDRKQAKVAPFPVASTRSGTTLMRKPVKARLGNALFSRLAEQLNVVLIVILAALLSVSYAFDSDLKIYTTTVQTLILSILIAYLFQDCAKFAILGCVSATQVFFRDTRKVIDSGLAVGCLLAIAVVLRSQDTLWDSPYFLSVSRLLCMIFAYKKVNETKLDGNSRQKAVENSTFSVELAEEKVQQVIQKVLKQPWVEYITNLKDELQWCLDVIMSNRLNHTILVMGNAEQGPKENELIEIVNQYSKAGDPPSVFLLRKPGTITLFDRKLLLAGSEVTEEVKVCFREVDTCEFDIFRLKHATNGNELFTLVHLLFLRKELLSALSLDTHHFTNYISRIQSGYNSTVLYHNATHAADVTQTMHYFLFACGAADALSLGALEISACYLSACAHDFEHPGLTNSFLVNTQSELAVRYNDKSVLENHHISSAFALAMDECCDIYSDIPSADYSKMRNLMIGMVLATDAVNHFAMLSRFKTTVESSAWTTSENTNPSLELLLHAADISNPTKPWNLCEKWADLVLNEFWLQGDKERKLGLPCSFLADRYAVNVAKSQIGFIDVIVTPLFEVLGRCLRPVEANRAYLVENREKWGNTEKGSAKNSVEQ